MPNHKQEKILKLLEEMEKPYLQILSNTTKEIDNKIQFKSGNEIRVSLSVLPDYFQGLDDTLRRPFTPTRYFPGGDPILLQDRERILKFFEEFGAISLKNGLSNADFVDIYVAKDQFYVLEKAIHDRLDRDKFQTRFILVDGMLYYKGNEDIKIDSHAKKEGQKRKLLELLWDKKRAVLNGEIISEGKGQELATISQCCGYKKNADASQDLNKLKIKFQKFLSSNPAYRDLLKLELQCDKEDRTRMIFVSEIYRSQTDNST